MPRPRRALISVADTPFYHVFSRCVRRAYLCGTDSVSGKCYEHRRGWIEDRLRVLASLFSIEVCAYAVMSNHYHLVVKLIPWEAEDWSDDEVLSRWTALHKGPILVQRHQSGCTLTAAELDTLSSIVAVYRQRLASLSWFMKCLNEPVARRANAEDDCTGHFWEARFQSQALRTERALIAAMAYVDLNPVRAGTADSPEASNYTSIRCRAQRSDTKSAVREAVVRLSEQKQIRHFEISPRPLAQFVDRTEWTRRSLPIREADYFQIVDVTGRSIAAGKIGYIDPALEPILERLSIASDDWMATVSSFRHHYRQGDIVARQSA